MRNKGFTIAEIMIVLLVGGALMAIATPSVAAAYRRSTLRGAVDQYISTHSLARSAALQYGRISEIHVASNGRFWVEVDTSSAGGVMDTVGVVKNLSGTGLTISGHPSIVCYDARGLPSTSGACQAMNATITFNLGSLADTLTVTVLGRVLR